MGVGFLHQVGLGPVLPSTRALTVQMGFVLMERTQATLDPVSLVCGKVRHIRIIPEKQSL